jgi:hypothetical protein
VNKGKNKGRSLTAPALPRMSDVALVVDYLPLPERHHHDCQVVDGGFAGAVAGTLGVAEAEAGFSTPLALALGPEGGSLSRTGVSRTGVSRTGVSRTGASCTGASCTGVSRTGASYTAA